MEADPEVRFFSPDEANALVPTLEAILAEMDGHAARAREAGELLEDLEGYWGEAVTRPGHPEHEAYVRLQARLQEALEATEGCARRVHDLGGHLKSYEAGLVDFYARQERRRVFLCWRRGEPAVQYYHELDRGFAGRKPLAP